MRAGEVFDFTSGTETAIQQQQLKAIAMQYKFWLDGCGFNKPFKRVLSCGDAIYIHCICAVVYVVMCKTCACLCVLMLVLMILVCV
jgi:hypothetical protein